jgi:hypothetical protein
MSKYKVGDHLAVKFLGSRIAGVVWRGDRTHHEWQIVEKID